MNVPPPPGTTARTDVFQIKVLVLMGVSGCGKTEVGRAVAERWGAAFQDGDDWHTAAAVARMAGGTPLSDVERAPWLERLREKVVEATPVGGRTVLACSALRRKYREALAGGAAGVRVVYLAGSRELIGARLAERRGHYMPAGLLDSQFAALEVPGAEEAVAVSIAGTVPEVAEEVMRAAGLDYCGEWADRGREGR